MELTAVYISTNKCCHWKRVNVGALPPNTKINRTKRFAGRTHAGHSAAALKIVKSRRYTGAIRRILETAKHSALQHATLTANQQYSTAAQLRLVHKRYTRESIRKVRCARLAGNTWRKGKKTNLTSRENVTLGEQFVYMSSRLHVLGLNIWPEFPYRDEKIMSFITLQTWVHTALKKKT